MVRRSTQNFFIALSFVGGVAARSWIPVPLVLAYALACAGLGAIVLAWKRERWRLAGVCLIILSAGIWRLDLSYRNLGGDDPSFFVGRGVAVSGMVARDPEVRLKTARVVVEVSEVEQPILPLKVRGTKGVMNEENHNSPNPSYPKRGISVKGKTLVIAAAIEPFEVGDRVSFRCDLEHPEPIEDFDYPRYLAKDGIFSVCNFPELLSRQAGTRGVRWVLARIKGDFIRSIERVVPEPESALLAGILTGTRGRLPDDVLDDFKTAGVSHLLAVSGFNIVVIAVGLLGMLTLFLYRQKAFPILAAIIIGFALLTGGEASVVRAAIMGLTLHLFYVTDRLYRPHHVLTLTAAIMLAFNPRLLRDDLGFDLSFLATWGIFALSPFFMDRLRWISDRWHLRELVAMTCAAQVSTLPLLIGSFERVSPASLPANIAIMPLVPFTMALGFAAGIAGMLPVIGRIAGIAAFAAARVILALAHASAGLPFASVSVPKGVWVAVVVAYIVIGLCWWKKELVRSFWRVLRKKIGRKSLFKSANEIRAQEVEEVVIMLNDERPPNDSPLVRGEGIDDNTPPPKKGEEGGGGVDSTVKWLRRYRYLFGGILVIVILLIVFLPPYFRSRTFSVTVFDVGQGDSIFVSVPGGQQLLIDGGPDAKVLSKLGSAMPWWDRTIEYVVLTHPHADHVTGLVEVLRRYNVGRIYFTGVVHTTDEYLAFLQEASDRKIPLSIPAAGDTIALGEARVSVLMPLKSYQDVRVQDLNESSVVLRLAYRDTSFLFTGDAGNESEPQLLMRWGKDIRSDVLKVGHHGSAYATSPEFLAAVAPRYAVISVGARNSYGHPSLRVVRRLEQAGTAVYRTDQEGDVRFTLKGAELQASVTR